MSYKKTCSKILLSVVEIRKAKPPVKVFLVTAGCACVATVTTGPKVPLFSSSFELLLSQFVQRMLIPVVKLPTELMKESVISQQFRISYLPLARAVWLCRPYL